jgi:hypothetical protein
LRWSGLPDKYNQTPKNSLKKKESGDGEDEPGHRPRPPGKGKKLWVADELMTFVE